MADGAVERLARDIRRCQVVGHALADPRAPCREVVEWQGLEATPRYCPEPWVGHLARAPILFLSSNPGAADRGAPPEPDRWLTNEASDEELFRSSDSAFEARQQPGIRNGKYLVDCHGTQAGTAVRYWVWAHRVARELLGGDPIPGTDYVLSEVVHCGTQREHGVKKARPLCTSRYLRRLLLLSPARIVIAVGAHALMACTQELGVRITAGEVWGPHDLLGRPRCVLGLPHPNRPGTRWGLGSVLGESEAERTVAFARER